MNAEEYLRRLIDNLPKDKQIIVEISSNQKTVEEGYQTITIKIPIV